MNETYSLRDCFDEMEFINWKIAFMSDLFWFRLLVISLPLKTKPRALLACVSVLRWCMHIDTILHACI